MFSFLLGTWLEIELLGCCGSFVYFCICLIFFFFFSFLALPMGYRSYQARDQIRATAATYATTGVTLNPLTS